ncbi:MAG TPA: GNAT family N-acetyltransferase [Gammaproteobacteria bacterium]|nr:GNAT family N-acetyltransferase [Gammaproteobacteria bacterium]
MIYKQMKLLSIKESQFALWKEMREGVYSSLDDEFHELEMKKIFLSDDWFCYFLASENSRILGLAELSSRNIVDGCLSTPVAYLEGLYIKKEYRGIGLGREAIGAIKDWCKEKGFAELGVDTELVNLKAQEFFKAVGFHETYRIVQFRTRIESA